MPTDVAIGDRVEMTFRRLFTADGIHNYFWKARPVRAAAIAAEDERMSSHGIKDRVAIVGMGCTPFGEHCDKGLDDLLIDASNQAFAAAGIDKDDVDAYWFGTAQSGMSGITLARPLQLDNKPVTRVENFCATGSEALRQAAYAVASGAYDIAMAVGVEKVKDSGYAGLNAFPIPDDGTARTLTAAAMFSMVAPAYAKKYGVDEDELKEVLARIAWKNHYNGARNPRAQFRREMSMEHDLRVAAGRRSARHLRLRGRGRRRRRRDRRAGRGRAPLHRPAALHQGAVVRGRQRLRAHRPRLRLHALPRGRGERAGRVRAGRHHRPSPRAGDGRGARLLHADRAGPHGGPRLRRAGHGVEGDPRRDVRPRRRAAGQPRRRAQELRPPGRRVRACACCSSAGCSSAARRPRTRRIGNDRPLALTHNLGGYPGEMVSFVSILGRELS